MDVLGADPDFWIAGTCRCCGNRELFLVRTRDGQLVSRFSVEDGARTGKGPRRFQCERCGCMGLDLPAMGRRATVLVHCRAWEAMLRTQLVRLLLRLLAAIAAAGAVGLLAGPVPGVLFGVALVGLLVSTLDRDQ